MPLSFDIGTIPNYDRKEAKRNWNRSEKGKQSKRKYRHNNSKHQTDAKYLSRKIVAVDGEGFDLADGRHVYAELAISNVEPIVNLNGLSSREILRYLFDNLKSEDINVIYGGSYDFNFWIRDFAIDDVKRAYASSYGSKPVWHYELGVRWVKGKAFEITDGKRTVAINDVISFFQQPFIDACDAYLGEYKGRDILVEMKAKRGEFTPAEIGAITDYNELELELLVQLVSELRERLNRVGLRPRRWNSPGAIASALFLREGVKAHRNEKLPEEVMRAARYAYAGGRFEVIKYGAVQEPAYEYDLNSAYPRALLDVPSLKDSEWTHAKGWDNKVHPFSLYRVEFMGSRPDIPGAVFVRGTNGTISYPLYAVNWIWSPELESLIEYCKVVKGARFRVLERWECTPATDVKPFAFIADLYRKRQELKARKDGAHVGIKLGLNSLYGKLAQQVGWKPATRSYPVRVPTYHQLEWAGYATAFCRSRVLLAALTDIESVIAFETDALFTTRPLNVEIGTGLGEWEQTKFRSLTYVQSGHYYATQTNGAEIVKCRGIDKGFISRVAVEAKLSNPEAERVLNASLTRFFGVGIALARGLEKYWCKWITEPKRLSLMPTGKRVHAACHTCAESSDGTTFSMGSWHSTICPVAGGVSSEYPVVWINPDPNMTELAELRESENYYE